MPGVPSSRGCTECRKTKKKCDQAKPSCSRCWRLGIECTGAGQQRFKFISLNGSSEPLDNSDSTPLPLRQRAPGQTLPLPPDRSLDADHLDAPEDVPERSSALFSPSSACMPLPRNKNSKSQNFSHGSHPERQRQRQNRLQILRQRLQRQQLMHRTAEISYSGAFSHSAENEGLINLFWESYLPNGKLLPGDTLTFGGLISAMESLSCDDRGFRNGMLALGLTTVGHRTGSQQTLQAGLSVYGDALRQVSRSLTPQRRLSPGQLIACRLFGLYEALFGTERQSHALQCRSWLLHIAGEAAMISANRPEEYIRGANHCLFVSGRHHIIFAAMVVKKKSFLSEPAWKTIPWLEHEKTPLDYLLDIVADLPSVIEGIETVESWEDAEKKETYRKLLFDAAQNLTDRMLAWNDRFPIAVLPHDLMEELPEFITLDNLTANHAMTLYWSICIRLVSIHRTLHRPGEHLEKRIIVDDYCSNLVRAIRLFIHPTAGMFRLHIATFPLSTAIQHLNSVAPDKMVLERLSLGRVVNDPACVMIRNFVESMDPMQAASITKFGEETCHDYSNDATTLP